ncbi:hypothetical protein Lser_V15G17384 [Lactuca serriola]
MHWVEWSKILALIADGGLGLNTLKAQNMALLIKWWWRLMNDHDSLWKEVIMCIHNLHNKPPSYIANNSFNGVWCNISKATNYLTSFNIDQHQLFSLIPGFDVKILFWKDVWCGNTPFHLRFPHLYLLETVKCCNLVDRMSSSRFSWRWKQEPSKPNELHELLQMYKDIEELGSFENSSFGFQFEMNESGEYKVNLMRKMIDSKLISYKGHKICWSKLIPLKVRCFVWRASMGRILVAESLAIRGIQHSHQICSLCNNDSESVDRILVNYEFAKEVQAWIFKWCGLYNRRFSNVLELIDSAASWGNCPKKKSIRSTVIFCLLWNIWLVRNDKVFRNTIASPTKVADNIISMSYTVADLCRAFGVPSHCSISGTQCNFFFLLGASA